MYCSLQEAYNIPAFDPASKSHRSRPPRYCGGAAAARGTGTTPPADPYDAYSNGSGRELAAAPASYGREDFTNPGEKVTYASMANDYKYYCDQYGVCADPLTTAKGTASDTAVREGFENPRPAPAVKKPKQPSQGSCGPLQPPAYEYPMSEEAKRQYNKAVKESLSYEHTATTPLRMEPRKVDMSQVSGYYDEDLESYLQTKDMKASPAMKPLPKVDLQAKPYDPSESPFSDAMQKFKDKQSGYPVDSKKKMSEVEDLTGTRELNIQARTDKIGMWMDLLLFVLMGVLVIFLCDQLVKLGMYLGMKSTVAALSPIISKLE